MTQVRTHLERAGRKDRASGAPRTKGKCRQEGIDLNYLERPVEGNLLPICATVSSRVAELVALVIHSCAVRRAKAPFIAHTFPFAFFRHSLALRQPPSQIRTPRRTERKSIGTPDTR